MTHATAKRITIRRPPEGTVLVIPLGDGTYGFGQVAVGGYAYFDLRSQNILSVDEIIASPIAFAVRTSEGVAKAAGWLHLGVATLKGRLAVDQSYRSQPVGSNQLYIYKGTQLLGDSLLPVQHDQQRI